MANFWRGVRAWGAAAVVAGGAAGVLPGAGAEAATLVGTTFGGMLYDIDLVTGAASNERSAGVANLLGIAANGLGELYGMSISFSVPDNLWQIDPVNGGSTLVGPTSGVPNPFEGGLAFNARGTLYGVQGTTSEGTRRLFSLNTDTGAGVDIGPVVTNGDLSALAFSPAGDLYVLDTSGVAALLKVDSADAAVLSNTSIQMAFADTAGMAFDPDTGVLYVSDGGTGGSGKLFTLDVGTGTLAEVGDTGIAGGIAGLTFLSDGPAELIGDYSGDGFVSQGDLDLILLNWGSATLPPEWVNGADDFDGQISQNELDNVLLNWGDGSPPTVRAVPEPASGGLVLLSVAAMVSQRRRD